MRTEISYYPYVTNTNYHWLISITETRTNHGSTTLIYYIGILRLSHQGAHPLRTSKPRDFFSDHKLLQPTYEPPSNSTDPTHHSSTAKGRLPVSIEHYTQVKILHAAITELRNTSTLQPGGQGSPHTSTLQPGGQGSPHTSTLQPGGQGSPHTSTLQPGGQGSPHTYHPSARRPRFSPHLPPATARRPRFSPYHPPPPAVSPKETFASADIHTRNRHACSPQPSLQTKMCRPTVAFCYMSVKSMSVFYMSIIDFFFR